MITGDVSSPGTTERVVRRTLEFAARVGLGAWGLGQRRRRGRVYGPGEIHAVDATSQPHEAFLDSPGRRAYGRAYGRRPSQRPPSWRRSRRQPSRCPRGARRRAQLRARLRARREATRPQHEMHLVTSPDAAQNVARLARLAPPTCRAAALCPSPLSHQRAEQ